MQNSLEAVKQLEEVLILYKKSDHNKKRYFFLMACKAFEVSIESIWKDLKKIAEKEGLEINSPAASFRAAAQLEIIEDAEFWLTLLALRNSSVHDYFGVSDEKYIKSAENLIVSYKKIKLKKLHLS